MMKKARAKLRRKKKNNQMMKMKIQRYQVFLKKILRLMKSKNWGMNAFNCMTLKRRSVFTLAN